MLILSTKYDLVEIVEVFIYFITRPANYDKNRDSFKVQKTRLPTTDWLWIVLPNPAKYAGLKVGVDHEMSSLRRYP